MTEKYQPKVGDRVRVVLEGEVSYTNDNVAYFEIGRGGESAAWYDKCKNVVSVERLPEPDPVWVEGDVVRGQLTWLRKSDGGWGSSLVPEAGVSDREISSWVRRGEAWVILKDGKAVVS